MRSIKRLNINNKGFSLVELIIAIAILAVVSAIILTFMNTSSNIFRRTSADVDIQTEAQMVANSISDLVIDCERTVLEEKVSLAGVPGVSDARTYDKSNSFVVLNDENKYYIFYDDKADKIFYLESIYNKSSKAWSPYVGSNAQLLAQNVTSFNYDLSELTTKKRLFLFNLDYTVGPKTFSGNYKVHMRNTIQTGTNFDVPPGSDTISTVSVSPSQYVTWYHKPIGTQFFAKVRGSSFFIDTGVSWKIEETGSGFLVDKDTGEMVVAPSGSTGISIPKFRVVATSTKDNSKSGYAEVLIKKITGLEAISVGGIVGDNEVNKLPAAVQMGTVTCVVQPAGWNLEVEDSAVTWRLQYKTNATSTYQELAYMDSQTKSYKNLNSDIAMLVPSKRTATIKLGKNAGSGIVFKITATSVIDNTKLDSYEFSVIKTATKFNDLFIRGAYINLNDYFLVNGNYLSVSDIRLKEMNYGKDSNGKAIGLSSSEVNAVNFKDGILYVDYDEGLYNKDYWTILEKGFNELVFEIDGTDQEGVNFTSKKVSITNEFNGVQLVKSGLEDIVISKGSSIDLPIQFIGYNFTNLNQLSLLADMDDLNAPGNANVNRYIAATITTGVGNVNDPVTNAKIKVSAKTSDKRYPENGIPFKTVIRDYYSETNTNNPWSQKYTVYVSNVVGKQLFVPGPESTLWASGVKTTKKTYSNYGPNKLSVELWYATVGTDRVYHMIYNGTEYLYNSGLNCWNVK